MSNRKINVLYVLHSTSGSAGATKAFLCLLAGLIKKGVHPTIAVPDTKGIFATLKENGHEVIVVPIRCNIYPPHKSISEKLLFFPRLFVHQFYIWWSVRVLVQKLKEKHINLIHTNVGVVNVGYKVARQLNVPHLYHIREYQDLDFDMHYFPTQKHFVKQVETAACITNGVKAHFHLSDNVKVVYDGVFSQSYEVSPTIKHKGYFLYAGRIEPTKGLKYLVEAYAIYKHSLQGKQPLPLFVAGLNAVPAFKNEIEEYAKRENFTEDLLFLGERKDIATLMQEATALIVSSLNEGFGLCMAEAMFNKCIVIGYDNGGTKEQFDNGLKVAGQQIGLRYKTIQQLAESLNTVHRNGRDYYVPMISRAEYVVKQLYSTESNTEGVWELYQSLMKHSS